MDTERKKFASELLRKEAKLKRDKEDLLNGQTSPNTDQDLLGKRNRPAYTKNVETLFDTVLVEKHKRVEDGRKEELRSLLCSVKVKWDEKVGGKSYNGFLLRLIFKKFGAIRKMTEDGGPGGGKKKVYLEFAEFDSATRAVGEFRGKEESLKVKFLVEDRRGE